MKKSHEEMHLLERLANGAFDGIVGGILFTDGGSTIWKTIKNGIPINYKQGPGGKSFNGKENERYAGALHILREWTTDEEKLSFLQKFGWLMKDDDVRAYSAKFKPTKK